MEDRQKEAEKIVKEMEESNILNKVEELIKDNKISFKYKDKDYRVRLLKMGEKDELDSLRRSKYGQLLQDKNILLEKDLIQVYKERGYDIEDLNKKIKIILAEKEIVELDLGKAIEKNETKSILDVYRAKIDNYKIQISGIQAQKTLLLEFSLENQMLAYVSKIITYLSLEEKNQDGIWERKFKTLDEFEKYDDEELITQAAIYSMMLQYL